DGISIKPALCSDIAQGFPGANRKRVRATIAERRCGTCAKGLAFVAMSELRSGLQRVSVDSASRRRRMEIYAFLIVTALLMPALAVATVGTYGLGVWIYQIFAGPPGPPSK